MMLFTSPSYLRRNTLILCLAPFFLVAGTPLALHDTGSSSVGALDDIDLGSREHDKRLWNPAIEPWTSEDPRKTTVAETTQPDAIASSLKVMLGRAFTFDPKASYEFDVDADCDGHVLHGRDLESGVGKYKATTGTPLPVAVADPPRSLDLGNDVVEFAYLIPAQYGHSRVSVAFWESRKTSFRGTEPLPPTYTFANAHYFDNNNQPMSCGIFS